MRPPYLCPAAGVRYPAGGYKQDNLSRFSIESDPSAGDAVA